MLETTFPRFSGTKFNCNWKSVFFRSQWALKDIPHCPSFLSNGENASHALGLQITERTLKSLSFLNIYWTFERSSTSFTSMISSFEAYLTSKLASKNVAFQLLHYPLCLSIEANNVLCNSKNRTKTRLSVHFFEDNSFKKNGIQSMSKNEHHLHICIAHGLQNTFWPFSKVTLHIILPW